MSDLEGKTAIIYSRVSTTDQKDHGYSLDNQEDRLIEFCNKNEVNVIKNYKEDFSGKNFNRPVFNELLEVAIKNKNRIDYLFVYQWDRFARNLLEALQFIDIFKNIGIEVNSTSQWIDYNIPSQKYMLALYLVGPEVENSIKSGKIKEANRKARKEGRWINMQPKGYIKGRDEFGKPLMQPCTELGLLITQLFKDFTSGLYSQEELRKLPKYKVLNLSRSRISIMLSNIVYAGKIALKAYKDEPACIVEALHEPLVSLETFQRVQIELSKRKRSKHKPNKINPKFPLRGFIKCPECKGNLTASSSRSKSGKKHSYYHCRTKKGCSVNIRSNLIHEEFDNLLTQLKPSKVVCELFDTILDDTYRKSENSKQSQLNALDKKEEKIKLRQKTLLDKLLDGVVKNKDYSSKEIEMDDQINKLENERNNLGDFEKDIKQFLSWGSFYFQNFQKLFLIAPIETKHKLLGSILDEKLEFSDGKYRTPQFKKGFGLIYQQIKGLEGQKKKTGDSTKTISREVPEEGVEPSRP